MSDLGGGRPTRTELHWPEWREDDHRWLPAWRGDFAADGLHMATVLAHDAASGRLAGAATVSCSEAQPETGGAIYYFSLLKRHLICSAQPNCHILGK